MLFDLPALLGIGMMLLAASPGGTTANLFSHLFRGDVALNITLTAINTVIAVVTLPVITGLAIAYYDRQDDVSMPLVEIVKVFALILLPVGIGMLVNARATGFARRMDKPVRIGSAVILAILVLGILLDQRENVGDYLADVGLITALFCAISLVVGYYVPKAFGVTGPQAIASSMEVGVHNATLAIFVAVEVLDEVEISVPAAVYSLDHVRLRRPVGHVGQQAGRRPRGRVSRLTGPPRPAARAARNARPRCEIRSFSPGSSSAEVRSSASCSTATKTTS